jgi:hypothetical protein
MFNLYWSLRPFGAALLVATLDKNGPALYAVDPAGTSLRYFGTAVGKARQVSGWGARCAHGATRVAHATMPCSGHS